MTILLEYFEPMIYSCLVFLPCNSIAVNVIYLNHERLEL